MVKMDSGDATGFADCFTEDATCEVLLTGTQKTGRGELEGLCAFLHEKFKTCRHWEVSNTAFVDNKQLTLHCFTVSCAKGNVCVDVQFLEGPDGDKVENVTNTSYWKALDGGQVVSTGIHRDTFRLCGSHYLIASRVIDHTWTKEGGHREVPPL